MLTVIVALASTVTSHIAFGLELELGLGLGLVAPANICKCAEGFSV